MEDTDWEVWTIDGDLMGTASPMVFICKSKDYFIIGGQMVKSAGFISSEKEGKK